VNFERIKIRGDWQTRRLANRFRSGLLLCGILSPLIYIGSDLVAGNLFNGYNFVFQSASELSAVGSPTSDFVVSLQFVYDVLIIAFGLGVWRIGINKRALRASAVLIIGNAAIGLVVDSFFRMNYAKALNTPTNSMNVILVATSVIFFLAAMIFGAIAFRNWFRFCTIGILLLFLVMAIIGSLSTPHIGVQERTMIYGYGVWVLALAVSLLRDGVTISTRLRVEIDQK
jgi:hypothetical protein